MRRPNRPLCHNITKNAIKLQEYTTFDLAFGAESSYYKDNISGAEDVVSTLKEVLEKFQPVIVEDPSKHLGVVGEKLQFTATLARKVHSDMYGCDILTFKDAEQNILMTFHGGKEVYEEGQTYNLIGTAKRHTEYRGVKQTQLSRIRKIKQ